MAVSMSEVRDLISEALPTELPAHLLRCVFVSWEEAWRDCEKYDWPERLYEWPYRRRADVEQNVRALASRLTFRDQIVASTEKTSNNSTEYTKLVVGRLVLTISAARSPWRVVRHANFRQAYALEHNLDFFRPSKLEPEDPVYGVLIHGQTRGARRLGWQLFREDPTNEAGLYVPSFCRIVVPSPDGKSYVGEFDLFREQPDVLMDLLTERNIPRPERPDLWPDFGTGTV